MTTIQTLPELCAGDVLTRGEFERRYDGMPKLKKAELIERVVYLSARRQYRFGVAAGRLGGWLASYGLCTPGLEVASNCSLRLDLDNETQPDLVMRLPTTLGHSWVSADDFLEGAPELVVDVVATRASYALHQKLHVYRRRGVAEYLVHRVDDGMVDWFVLRDGVYERQEPDARGQLHSTVFPGLSLDLAALLCGDLVALRTAVEAAVAAAGPAHAALVQRLHAPGIDGAM